MKTHIHQYIRDGDGHPYGVVVASKQDDGTINLGYSLCHKNDRNNFDKKLGLQIALNRANSGIHYEFPSSKTKYDTIMKYFNSISDKAMSYFKCNVD